MNENFMFSLSESILECGETVSIHMKGENHIVNLKNLIKIGGGYIKFKSSTLNKIVCIASGSIIKYEVES